MTSLSIVTPGGLTCSQHEFLDAVRQLIERQEPSGLDVASTEVGIEDGGLWLLLPHRSRAETSVEAEVDETGEIDVFLRVDGDLVDHESIGNEVSRAVALIEALLHGPGGLYYRHLPDRRPSFL